MPAKYERIRDNCIKTTDKPSAKCREMAARIYNAQRKPGQAPVTGKHKGR